MNYYNVLVGVAGGLVFFLYGMNLMSAGLAQMAGERMRKVLRFCASNRFSGVVAGATVTAVIQSSSATTVMVVGFANAGLLTLQQSMGIIFGANIGTTITAQLVAFKIDAIVIPAIVLGFILSLFSNERLKGIGTTIFGLGLLFYGMDLMGSELKELGTNTSFQAIFKCFDCQPSPSGFIPLGEYLGAISIGLIATVIMQSSSASTGIIIALGASGALNIYTATALVLGTNIGTTITAQLAAMTANRLAKQTALAHTLFNVFGVIIISITFFIPVTDKHIPLFFYVTELITAGGSEAASTNLPRLIANSHTLFNVTTTLLLLPFVSVFAKICERMLPTGSDIKFQYLERHLLADPLLAIDQVVFALQKMLTRAWRTLSSSTCDVFIVGASDSSLLENLKKDEERVDRMQYEITRYLSELMQRGVRAETADMIPSLLHCTNDTERIGDRAANILSLAEQMENAGIRFSAAAVEEIKHLFGMMSEQYELVRKAFHDRRDVDLEANSAIEAKIVEHCSKMEAMHTERFQKGDCNAEAGIIYMEFSAECIAISRHLTNIYERAQKVLR